MAKRKSLKFLCFCDEEKPLIVNKRKLGKKPIGLGPKTPFNSDNHKLDSTLDLSNITDENANYVNERYKSDSFCIPNDHLSKYESFDSPRRPMELHRNKKQKRKKYCEKLKVEITGIHWEGNGKRIPLKLKASSSVNLLRVQPITLDNTPGGDLDIDDDLVKKYFIKYKIKYEMMKSIMFQDQIENSFGSMIDYSDSDLERKYAAKYKMKFMALKVAQGELSNSNTEV